MLCRTFCYRWARTVIASHSRFVEAQVQGAIESLKLVTGHLAAWSLPKYVHVTVEPYLRPHAEYFTGVAFQVCVY